MVFISIRHTCVNPAPIPHSNWPVYPAIDTLVSWFFRPIQALNILNADSTADNIPLDEQRHNLRQQMRDKRRALASIQQSDVAVRCAKRLTTLEHWQSAQHIALYIADDGEVVTTDIIEQAWQAEKQVYLPVVTDNQNMQFICYRKNTRLVKGKFGIPAPEHTERTIDPALLDIIVTPLVCFDTQGNRMGRGGGYYDRLLQQARASLAGKQTCKKPLVIGLAHEFQQVQQLPARQWDEPLDAVITAFELFTFDNLNQTDNHDI